MASPTTIVRPQLWDDHCRGSALFHRPFHWSSPRWHRRKVFHYFALDDDVGRLRRVVGAGPGARIAFGALASRNDIAQGRRDSGAAHALRKALTLGLGSEPVIAVGQRDDLGACLWCARFAHLSSPHNRKSESRLVGRASVASRSRCLTLDEGPKLALRAAPKPVGARVPAPGPQSEREARFRQDAPPSTPWVTLATGLGRVSSGFTRISADQSSVFETADKPRRDAKGNAINRTVLFRRELANIKDTWHVIGLRGTSSNDYEVSDLFVPEEYTTWRDSVSDRRERRPLYNIPMLTLYGVGFSGVALGIAGSCLGAFMQLAQTKTSGGGVGSTAVLRDNAVIQSRVARACGRLESARAFLLQMLREIWTASAGSGALSLEQRARLRIAITGAMEAARKVVDFTYRAAGTTAIFEGSPFERRFRDLHTLLAQGQAHLSNFESAGQALFGIEPAQRL
jgi:Acyl-CoA dehydrogenase, C-terminal domain